MLIKQAIGRGPHPYRDQVCKVRAAAKGTFESCVQLEGLDIFVKNEIVAVLTALPIGKLLFTV